MDILHNKFNSLPEQVEENRQNIEKLAEATGYPEGNNIQSTGEPNGKVLTSDGNGGASWEEPATPPTPEDIEGTDIKSTGQQSGKVLTTDGNGGASWEEPATPPTPEDIEGTDIKSTGQQSGKVLTANGIGGAKWDNIVKVVTLENSTGILSNDDYNAVLNDNTVIRYPVQIGGYGYFHKSYTFSTTLFYSYMVQINATDEEYTFTKYICRIQADRHYTITETTYNIPKTNILQISAVSGTLTQAQYNTLIANEQNIVIFSSSTQPEYKTIFRYENRIQDWDSQHYIRQYVNANNSFTELDGNIIVKKFILSVDETTLQYNYTITEKNLSTIYQRRDLLEGTVVKSTSIPQGKVLTANGNGGASWETIQGGQYILTITSASGSLSTDILTKLENPSSIIIHSHNNITDTYFMESITSATIKYRCVKYDNDLRETASFIKYKELTITRNARVYSISEKYYNIFSYVNIESDSGTLTLGQISHINSYNSPIIDSVGNCYYKYLSIGETIYYYSILDINYDTTNNDIYAQYKIIDINPSTGAYQVLSNTIDFSNTYQKKLTAEKGLSIDSDNKIGHSNTAIPADTEEKLKVLKADEYGHIISYTDVDVTKTEVEYLKGCTKPLKAQTATGTSALSTTGVSTGLSITATSHQGTTTRVTKTGNMVFASIFLQINCTTAFSSSWVCLGTIASGYRPATRTAITWAGWAVDPSSAAGYVDTDGKIYAWASQIGTGTNRQYITNSAWYIS